MAEAYDYFAGINAYAGNNKVKADPTGLYQRHDRGPHVQVAGGDDSCQKNFIIVISNGPFSGQLVRHVDRESNLSAAGGRHDDDQPA